jgi:hypothetical protein
MFALAILWASGCTNDYGEFRYPKGNVVVADAGGNTATVDAGGGTDATPIVD